MTIFAKVQYIIWHDKKLSLMPVLKINVISIGFMETQMKQKIYYQNLRQVLLLQ